MIPIATGLPDMNMSIKDQAAAMQDPMFTVRNTPQFDCDLCEMYNTAEGGRAFMIWSKDQITNLNTLNVNNRITLDMAFKSCKASCVFNDRT